jgi:hypothetical protein
MVVEENWLLAFGHWPLAKYRRNNNAFANSQRPKANS